MANYREIVTKAVIAKGKKLFTTNNTVKVDKLNILIDKMGIIIENSKENKNYIFDLTGVNEFIEKSVQVILTELKNYIPN